MVIVRLLPEMVPALAYTPYGVVLLRLVAVPDDDNLQFHVAVANVHPFFVPIDDEAVSHASLVEQACLLFVLVSTEHSQTIRS